MTRSHHFKRESAQPEKDCPHCDGEMYFGREVVREAGEIVEELSPGLRCDACGFVQPG